MRERMPLDRLGFPCLPLCRAGFAYCLQYHFCLMFMRKRTKHTSAGPRHPCISKLPQPINGFGNRRKQLGCHDLQVVFSEANWCLGKVRYFDGFRVSCQTRIGKYRCGRCGNARFDHHIPVIRRVNWHQCLANPFRKCTSAPNCRPNVINSARVRPVCHK